MEILNQQFTHQSDEKKRLDVFLREQLLDKSRSFIQKNIKAGNVKVNDKVEKTVHFWLKFNNTITWRENIVKDERLNETATKALPAIEIVHETKNYIIINKPAKLLVHALPDKPNTTSLIDWLIDKYPQTKQLGENPLRPALVHRLDKEVSGLMVIPLTQVMYDHLKKEFKLHRVYKEYSGLVYGKFEDVEGEISLPISRSKKTGKMAAHSKKQGGKNALTKYEVIKKYVNFSLLKIQIETGRTNQIRVHLQALGHSIVGDGLYKSKDVTKPADLSRVFLQASKLSFTLPAGEQVTYELPLPDILTNFLQTLK